MTEIIPLLDTLLATRGEDVRAWFDDLREKAGAPFYTSVDLRHAGFKLAPVDTNLFPAGFNNLSPAAITRAVEAARPCIARLADAPRVLIIPENHTRNLAYLDNLVALCGIVEKAGAEVRLGSLLVESEPLRLQSASGHEVVQYALQKEGNALRTKDGFTPQLIVLNNDLTSGMPDILRGITQPITPRPGLGWYRRRKSIHFDAYDKLARAFAAAFDLDAWLISSVSHKCGQVNFDDKAGLECVALGVERVLKQVREHYTRYGITHEPYVFVKSDAGTYGMGIMTVRSGEELFEINKKTRNKMRVIKEGVENSEVMIQEGIPSIDVVQGAPAEPMMYLMQARTVGGAYRINPERDATGNLNASGMQFVRMCDDAENVAGAAPLPSCSFGAFGLVASLAALAAQQEEYGEWYSI